MKVGVLCEESGVVRDAFAARGHDAWSCDILPRPGKHIRGDCLAQDWSGFDLLICFPPCTYLCNSGLRWLYNRDGSRNTTRWGKMLLAVEFFKRTLGLADKYKCRLGAENSMMHTHAAVRIGKPDQVVQPWMFGDWAQKTTGLWIRGLPMLRPLFHLDKYTCGCGRVFEESLGGYGCPNCNGDSGPATMAYKGEFITTSGGKRLPKWYSEAKSSSKVKTQRERSRTFPGIARAMAEQWGAL